MPAAPSLLIVPYRSKTGRLYSQIPVPVAPATTGAGDFTVTRNTEARRFNSAGLIESVASGIPRLDYLTSGGTAGCPALLVEPAGTNLAFHSENWGNWTLDGATRVTGSTSAFLAPDNTFTATALSPTSGSVFHGLFSNPSNLITYASGTIYTQSAFFKQGTGVAGRYVQLTYTGGGQFTQNGYANFDLQLGTVVVVSGTSADTNRTARIENYGNGWYRCSFTATCNTAGNSIGVLPVLVNTSGNTRAQSFSGTVTDVIYGWGAQLETGSVATSYIPTTAGTGSRSADVISVSGASGFIGQTEGTIYLEVDAANASTQFFRITPAAGSVVQNSIQIYKNSSGIYQARIYPSSSNFNIVDTAAKSGFVKIALAYKSGESALVINGGTPITSATAISFSEALNVVNFAAGVESLKPTRIRAVALYTTRLTDAELATLTTL